MKNLKWTDLNKPIIGLSPMDGVTDAPFRYMITKYGKPDITFTEFTSVEGICAGAKKPMQAFIYGEKERPIIAQLFGNTPECFYKASFVILEMGFDGLDINMGCPSKNVASKGSGASLIQTPTLAKNIVKQSKKAVKDWAEGKTIADIDLPEEIIKFVKKYKPKNVIKREIPVSIKTRIGVNSNIATEWINHLLETEPSAITIHGRTLKQMYSGKADWEAIASAATLIHKTNTIALGNGDIQSYEQAKQYAKQYNVDGILVGRATFGKPWFFNEKMTSPPSIEEIFKMTIEHSKMHEKLLLETPFLHMRKHLAWYCRGFHDASTVRQELMKAENPNQVKKILNEIKMDSLKDSR